MFGPHNVVVSAILDYGRLDGASTGLIRDDALEITTYYANTMFALL